MKQKPAALLILTVFLIGGVVTESTVKTVLSATILSDDIAKETTAETIISGASTTVVTEATMKEANESSEVTEITKATPSTESTLSSNAASATIESIRTESTTEKSTTKLLSSTTPSSVPPITSVPADPTAETSATTDSTTSVTKTTTDATDTTTLTTAADTTKVTATTDESSKATSSISTTISSTENTKPTVASTDTSTEKSTIKLPSVPPNVSPSTPAPNPTLGTNTTPKVIFTTPHITTELSKATTNSISTTVSTINTTSIVTTTEVTKTTEEVTTTQIIKVIMLCNQFHYVVTHARTRTACILTNMMVNINLRYAMENFQIGQATLTVPARAKVIGDCGENVAQMILSWNESNTGQADDKENKITFQYKHDNSVFFLDFVSIDVYLDAYNFPKATEKRMKEDTAGRHLRLFSAPLKLGIHVSAVPLLETKVSVNQIDVVFSDIVLIAFRGCVEHSKKEANCLAEENINALAIIGGIIGAITLILVISYFIWRKRKNDVARSKNMLL